MKIGIDIDDTTFLTVKSMLKYADIFEEEISGVPTNRDSFETCRQLTENGIKSILMTTKMNEKIESGDIVRVNNWAEIYDEVEKYREQIK